MIIVDELANLRSLRKVDSGGEHFQYGAAAALGARTGGADFHAFIDTAQARRHERLNAGHFDDANATQAVGRAVVVIANGRNMTAEFFCGLEDCRLCRHVDSIAIDCECDISHKDLPFPYSQWEYWSVGFGNITPSLQYSNSYVGFSNSSGHSFIALNTAVGAV